MREHDRRETEQKVQSESESRLPGRLRRRDYLRVVGTAGAVGLAGCSEGTGSTETTASSTEDGDGDETEGDSETATETEAGEPIVDEFHFTFEPKHPSKANYNWFNLQTRREPGMCIHTLLNFSVVDQAYHGVLLDDWALDGTTLTLTLKEGYKWHSGDPVDARDLVINYRLQKHLEAAYWDQLESVEEVDDYTVELTLTEELPEDIALWKLVNSMGDGGRLTTPKRVYEEYLERFENAESDDTREQIKEELVTMKVEDPDLTSNALWREVETSDEYYRYEVFEDHPAAENVNFSTVYEHHRATTEKQTQRFLSGKDDTIPLLRQTALREQLPENAVEIRKPSYSGSPAVIFNHEIEPWDDVNVRKAFAYLANRKQIAGNVSPIHYPDRYLTGLIDPGVEDKYLGDIVDQFEDYGFDESQEEKAAEALRRSGYEKQDGVWQKDGEPLEATMTHFTWQPDIANGAQSYRQTLNDFGIQVEFSAKETGTLWPAYTEGDFEIGIGGYWGGRAPLPAIDLPEGMFDGWMIINYPSEVDVPMPIGDPDGSTETIDVDQTIQDLRTATSESEKTELVTLLAWVVNQDLPRIPIANFHRGQTFTTDHWNIPSKDDAEAIGINRLNYSFLKNGLLTAKTE